MPNVIIIAGPNGAGKTTAAPILLQDVLHVDDFINADVIAQGLCGFQPEKEAIRAGRIMLKRIHSLANKRINFAFETTLASRTFVNWIPELKKQGYQIFLVFLWLEDVDLAVSRVKERIQIGGHSVPEKTIRRRYSAGIKNFFNLYQPLLDHWKFYNNSNIDNLSLIASGTKDNVIIENQAIWQQLFGSNYRRNIMASKNYLSDEKISKAFDDSANLTRKLQRGIQAALLKHKQAGNSVCEWRNNKVTWIPPKHILVKLRQQSNDD